MPFIGSASWVLTLKLTLLAYSCKLSSRTRVRLPSVVSTDQIKPIARNEGTQDQDSSGRSLCQNVNYTMFHYPLTLIPTVYFIMHEITFASFLCETSRHYALPWVRVDFDVLLRAPWLKSYSAN